jgi:methylmalonyl-CoA mutase
MTEPASDAGFPQATRDQWLGLVEKTLKGASFEQALVSRTADDIAIQPLYGRAADAPRTLRQELGPWRIAQRLDHPEPREANRLALADLDGGADSIVLVASGAPSARGFGVSLASAGDVAAALKGLMLDLIALRLEPCAFEGPALARHILDYVAARKLAPNTLSIAFGLDPIGDLARHGGSPRPWGTIMKESGALARDIADFGSASTFSADGRVIHEAGGSQAQELAFVLATATAYLRLLETGGRPLEEARDALAFVLAADADQFQVIAKFRALRRLWANVEQACGLAPKPIRVHAETAWRMMTKRDPWVNMLRTTIAAFSAGVAGADSITVLPFTSALGLPDPFARRMARNTQLILLEESNVWRVADPAAGSGGLEALTDQLAERAWSMFQAIEKGGGIEAALRHGIVQGHVATVRTAREKTVAIRREAITGTSEFPHLGEGDVAVLMPAPPNQETITNEFAPLVAARDAEPFERLRDRADELTKARGKRPAVFLANLGPLVAFNARATFAKNLFEAGGIEAVSNDGFDNMSALARAFRESGAKLVCICSNDETYEKQAANAAETLQNAGATVTFVAGRPQKLHELLRGAAAIRYIFAGCDAVSTLGEALDAV